MVKDKMAKKNFRLSNKKKYDLGIPMRQLVGEYEAEIEDIGKAEVVIPYSRAMNSYIPMKTRVTGFRLSDLLVLKGESTIEQKLLEDSIN